MSIKRIQGPNPGIWNDGSDYAVSIVVSGGYVDDSDDMDTICTRARSGDPTSGRQIKDQELTRGNKGLYNSMKLKYPVRVIRGFQEKLVQKKVTDMMDFTW